MSVNLVIVGGTVVDFVLPRVARLPSWPRHTESTPDNLVLLRRAPIMTLGGNGANAAYVAARCSAKVTLHTLLGADALGGFARGWLEEAGCRVEVPGRVTATAVNITAANSRQERAIFYYAGDAPAMPAIMTSLPVPTHLLVCGWPHPPLAEMGKELGRAHHAGVFTALDAGPILDRPWTMATLRTVFTGLDLFLANDYELRQITGMARLDSALARIRNGFAGHVVVKRGAEGALWLPAGSDFPEHAPGRRVRVVNTVGAGDTFNGALLAGLAQGGAFPDVLHTACATASSVVASRRGVLGVRPPRGSRQFQPGGDQS